jgi:hypothetical protein
VYLGGEYVGTTPYTMSDTKIVGSTTAVRLEYPGYETLNTAITRNEEFDTGACIAGVFLLVPFLWIQGYKPVHSYELRPMGYGPPPGQGYPPPGQYPQPQPQGYPQPSGQPAPQPQPTYPPPNP